MGRWTSHGFFRYLVLLPHSLANHSFLDGSSYALVNPCGCWQFWGHRSKCTSRRFHPMEGSWYFNQSVPRRTSSFPRLVINIWTRSVCVLPLWSWTVRFASRPRLMRPALLIVSSTFRMQMGWLNA